MKRLQCTDHAITRALRSLGVSSENRVSLKDEARNKLHARIWELHAQDELQEDIADRVDCAVSTVNRVLRKTLTVTSPSSKKENTL
jgi:hypothetical protein